MELYLIRHGIAAERGTYANDEERPLTDIGRKKTKQVAKQLRKQGLHFDLILSSPLVRSRETAMILQNSGLSSHVEEFTDLAPDGDIHAWVSWLEDQWHSGTNHKSLALVGHQPDLGNWAQMLTFGSAQEKFILKKAGVMGLNLPNAKTPIAQSELFLLTSPRWLLSPKEE